jgi:CubicO group peptidase (beta-lactamase class C family)
LFVSKATRFQAASISKTVNALLVLTLVRDGVVNLDDPVNKHLKSFTLSGPDADQVTVRMLSSHSGGTSVEGFAGYIPGQPLPSLRQILAGGAPANNAAVKVVRALGSYAYSGGGTMVLQQILCGSALPHRAATKLGIPYASGEDRISLWDGASSTDLLLLAHMC